MKRVLCALAAFLLTVPPFAQIKPCEDLNAEIAAKIDANWVTAYQLELIPIDQESDWKVVGTCDGGTMKIVYRRG